MCSKAKRMNCLLTANAEFSFANPIKKISMKKGILTLSILALRFYNNSSKKNSPVWSRDLGLRLFFSQQLTPVIIITTIMKQPMVMVAIPAGVAKKLSMFDVMLGISLSSGSSGDFETGGVKLPSWKKTILKSKKGFSKIQFVLNNKKYKSLL